jgi:hypothetical protein
MNYNKRHGINEQELRLIPPPGFPSALEIAMAHLIDTTTGQAAIAYVGEAPWHKLGQRLTAGADLETWRREAGLAYTVQRTPVLFQRAHAGASDRIEAMAGRDVLYRSDTGAPLSVFTDRSNCTGR